MVNEQGRVNEQGIASRADQALDPQDLGRCVRIENRDLLDGFTCLSARQRTPANPAGASECDLVESPGTKMNRWTDAFCSTA